MGINHHFRSLKSSNLPNLDKVRDIIDERGMEKVSSIQ